TGMHRRFIGLLAGAAMMGVPVAGVAAQGIPLIPKRPTIGIMAGVNLASLGGDDITDVDNRTGVMGGIYVTFHLTSTFGIQPEAIYSQRGADVGDGVDVDATIKMDYIDIPVLLRFDIPVVGPIQPFFVAGPSFGFQSKCAMEAESEG